MRRDSEVERGLFATLRKGLLFALLSALAIGGVALYGCSDDETDPGGPDITTGTVNGRVVEPVSQNPIEGAVVSLTGVPAKAALSTSTNANGEYSFAEVETGTYVLTVDASGVTVDPGNPDLEFVGYTTQVTVRSGETTQADGFLPVVDTSAGGTVTPGEPTVIEPEDIAGLRIEIDADAVTFPDGSASGDVFVVQLGFDQGPIALPEGWAPGIMIRILPEGTTFDPPARITFPNRDEVEAESAVELFSYDRTQMEWSSDGRCTSTGDRLVSNPGVGIAEASTHFVVVDPNTIVGRILDQEESAVSGAAVQVWARINPFGEGRETVKLAGMGDKTDTSGEFTVVGVRAGIVALTAELDTPETLGELEVEARVVDPSGTTDVGTLIMHVATETIFGVSGTVRTSEGTPVVEAHVEYFEPGVGPPPGENNRTFTDGSGNYELRELVGTPGREMGIYVWHQSTGFEREQRFTVPPLKDSGKTVEVDLTVCDPVADFSLCGDRGTWLLRGNELEITNYEVQCGDLVTDSQLITLVSLVEGELTMLFEEGGQTTDAVMTRVSGDGPTGISAANLPGLYLAEMGEGPAILAIYPDGTFTWHQPRGTHPEMQYGTYTSTAGQLEVTFLYSTDEQGPPLGEPQAMDYSLEGNTLTFIDTEGSEVFERCEDRFGTGIEGAWITEYTDDVGGFNLVLFNGEFGGVSRAPDVR